MKIRQGYNIPEQLELWLSELELILKIKHDEGDLP